jgi:hypothetical protein
MGQKISRYGIKWDLDNFDDFKIERWMIRKGGYFQNGTITHGNGLFFHYKQAQMVLWPDKDHHRWSDLQLKTILEQRITVIQGSKDTGKTHVALARYGLTDYFCFPEDTLILISSTDLRGLELRVWGEIKDMLEAARERFDYLPGHVLDSKHGVFTDSVTDDTAIRDLRKGIICIPCIGGQGEWVGLEKYVGIKQKRRRLLGDEVSFMHINYVTTLSNLDKGDFKGVFVGNPIGGNGKALDKLAEPVGGWESIGEVTETKTWKNKYDGITINLVGPDSPNFDKDRIKHYPYLIDQEDVDRAIKRYGKDSSAFWSQIMGVRKTGIDAHKVMTVEMIQNKGGFEEATWEDTNLTHVIGIDAGFGGDLCKLEWITFGNSIAKEQIMQFRETILIPVAVGSKDTVEDQISYGTKAFCDMNKVPYGNVFFEAGMWASLAISMARILSSEVNAVNFGGAATDRPVDYDTYVWDEKEQKRRLKKCSEHYSKFVTELWFSVRAVVDCKQARHFSRTAADQFALREWYFVKENKYELETKDEYKKRTEESPNDADAVSVAVEGARRRGFKIKSGDIFVEKKRPNKFESDAKDYSKLLRGRQLKAA